RIALCRRTGRHWRYQPQTARPVYHRRAGHCDQGRHIMSKQSNVLLNWIVPGIAAVAVAVVVLVWQWPHITATTAPAPAATAGASTTAQSLPYTANQSAGTGLAQSADHVQVLALRDGDTVTARITV